MRVSKWGNNLAVRLPCEIVNALTLKEGDEIELHVLGNHDVAISKIPNSKQRVERLRKFEGRLPIFFVFNRADINKRR